MCVYCSKQSVYFTVTKTFLIEIFIYNIVLVSGVQQSDFFICVYIFICIIIYLLLYIIYIIYSFVASLVAQLVKNLPAMQETWV